jgi:FAD/FMN-containing dehydrogenase
MKTVRNNHVGHDPVPTPDTIDAPSLTESGGQPNPAYTSWSNYPVASPRKVIPLHWQPDELPLADAEGTILPFGYGRSYGDTCLNNGGTIVDATPMNRFIALDATNGVLRCEAGVMLADILELIVPQGWFLPVTPGTKFVSVGGAIANDVHGKNHHTMGTFGRHVTQFELLRSDGKYLCSPTENSELYRATIGGLGLTGLILWAEFRLQSIPGPYIEQEIIRFGSLEEFFEIAEESQDHFKYTVSWIDCQAKGKNLGRGWFQRGNFAWQKQQVGGGLDLTKVNPFVPFDLPNFAINRYTVQMANQVIYRRQLVKKKRSLTHYEPFFYPLDSIHHWNRIYGNRGFLQHQCVVPYESDHGPIRRILETIAASGEGSFLIVFKTFGEVTSPGMLSFPRPGVTLALDFAMQGESTLRLCDQLDEIVREAGGAIYPAKDARMSAKNFQTFYPQWREFSRYIDPNFSSSFWRRVTS